MDFATETGTVDPKEVAKMVDTIPEFKIPWEDLNKCREGKGLIPSMSNWFYPRNEKGMLDQYKIYAVTDSADYKSWEPGKYIEEIASWKEKYHAVPYFLDPDAKKIIDEWQEKGEFQRNFDRVHYMAVSANVVRLLTHENAPACRDFALATLKYAPNFTDDEERRIFPDLLDGNGMAQFWTIAPYIYESLRTERLEKGQTLNDKEDYQRILMWSVKREVIGRDGGNAKYPGISEINDCGVSEKDLELSKDGNHFVHKFAEMMGKHLASSLRNIPVSEDLIKNTKVKRERQSF